MKKHLFILMGLILLFSACSNNEDVITKSSQMQKEASSMHFYGVKQVNEKLTKGVAQKDKLWYNGTSIKVKFLNGSKGYQDKVKTYAAEWEQYANIKFEFVENEKANVRVGFDWNEDRYITWSYIGTDCKAISDQNEATMSFAYWDSSSEEEIKGDVLRAFGQVLGLELEHRHLEFTPNWTNKIKDYWQGEIEDATWEDLKEYVFDPLDAANVIRTKEYDKNSIMIWPFSKKYAASTARDYNYELSEMDREFIKQVYPKEEIEWSEPRIYITSLSDSIYFEIDITRYGIEGDKVMQIDWGDGNIESMYTSDLPNSDQANYKLHHIYKVKNAHIIKIYSDHGSLHKIYSISAKGYPADITINMCSSLTYLNWRGLNKLNANGEVPSLLDLVIASTKIEELDLSNYPNLKNLILHGMRNVFPDSYLEIKSLDVTKNSKLKELSLYCVNCNFETLDLSQNLELEELWFEYTYGLKEFDLTNNIHLEYIRAWGNQDFSKLDLSNLKELGILSMIQNPLFSLSQNSLKDCINLHYLDVSQTNLSEPLDFSNNINLSTVKLDYTPLSQIKDSEMIIQTIKSLPSLNGYPREGSFEIHHSSTIHSLAFYERATNIASEKNWIVKLNK